MAMNISDRKRRSRILESPCDQWLNSELAVICRCGQGTRRAIGRFPIRSGETMGHLVRRLSCSRSQCRQDRPAVFVLGPQQAEAPANAGFLLSGPGVV